MAGNNVKISYWEGLPHSIRVVLIFQYLLKILEPILMLTTAASSVAGTLTSMELSM